MPENSGFQITFTATGEVGGVATNTDESKDEE